MYGWTGVLTGFSELILFSLQAPGYSLSVPSKILRTFFHTATIGHVKYRKKSNHLQWTPITSITSSPYTRTIPVHRRYINKEPILCESVIIDHLDRGDIRRLRTTLIVRGFPSLVSPTIRTLCPKCHVRATRATDCHYSRMLIIKVLIPTVNFWSSYLYCKTAKSGAFSTSEVPHEPKASVSSARVKKGGNQMAAYTPWTTNTGWDFELSRFGLILLHHTQPPFDPESSVKIDLGLFWIKTRLCRVMSVLYMGAKRLERLLGLIGNCFLK